MSIVINTPTSNIGRALAARLLDAGERIYRAVFVGRLFISDQELARLEFHLIRQGHRRCNQQRRCNNEG